MKKTALLNSTAPSLHGKARIVSIDFPEECVFIRRATSDELERLVPGQTKPFYVVLDHKGIPMHLVCGNHYYAFRSAENDGYVPLWLQ